MKIAILGGGFTGLTAAYFLKKKGHEVTLFEQESILGGLAAGFYGPGWEWPLERAYHHLFTNDYDILTFAKEVNFTDLLYKSPETASLYEVDHNYRTFPVDTPQDFLKFPLLSWPAKLRTAGVAAFLKMSPPFSLYEKQTAEEFLRKYSGEEGWNVFWEPLMRKKFGKYAEKVLASFIWTRIKKRTKNLVYIRGGFQSFIDHLERLHQKNDIQVLKNHQVISISSQKGKFVIGYSEVSRAEKERNFIYKNNQEGQFDAVISSLPTAIMSKVTQNLFEQSYLEKFNKLKYMSAINLILETEELVHDRTYWLSCCVKDFPFLVTIQHTNMIDKKHYGNKHILYVGNYVENNSPILKMNKKEIINYVLPYLQKISLHNIKITNSFHFRAAFAQPIFDKQFIQNMPHFETPIKNFYIANLDMTYPQDRGTNYAVKLGKEVVDRFF